MGNAYCSKCCQCTDNLEIRNSVIFTQIVLGNYSVHQEAQKQQSRHKRNSKTVDLNRYDISKVIRIQSCWRGYQNRLQYRHLKFKFKRNHDYFSTEEFLETISACKFLAKRLTNRSFDYSNGASYTGQWVGGFRHGKGFMCWNDGSEFYGMWYFGMPFGNGKFIHFDGEVYEGDWRNHNIFMNNSLSIKTLPLEIKDGFGNFYSVWLFLKHERSVVFVEQRVPVSPLHKSIVKGILARYKDAQQSATRIEEQINSKFKSYETILPESHMLNIKTPQGHYIGEMINSEKDGFGKMIFTNGDIYEGQWKESYRHGIGRYKWTDGSYHVGNYILNKKNGPGIFVWDDLSKFIGEFANDSYNGIGEYFYSDGQSYLGEWQDGQMHGFGIFVSKTGLRYEGMWVKGKLHGEAYTIHSDGKLDLDMWRDGVSIKRIN